MKCVLSMCVLVWCGPQDAYELFCGLLEIESRYECYLQVIVLSKMFFVALFSCMIYLAVSQMFLSTFIIII